LFDAPNNSAAKFFAAVVECINRPLLPFDHASNAEVDNLFTVFLGIIHPSKQFWIFLLKRI
jgi:hypothetical protein